ncbi:MAG: hypothetical protein DI535_11250 [Citrobacter freundii]|nr:MAG: hypothetical protein DI535_11250 [Citrobacter freundii]
MNYQIVKSDHRPSNTDHRANAGYLQHNKKEAVKCKRKLSFEDRFALLKSFSFVSLFVYIDLNR